MEHIQHNVGCKTFRKIPENVKVVAEFKGINNCYRTKLLHFWSTNYSDPKTVMFCMMNPSSASEYVSDSTVDKCRKFAINWGYTDLLIANALAYRATQPKDLLTVDNPSGWEYNEVALKEMSNKTDLIILAHGRLPKKLQVYAHKMINILRESGKTLYALKVSSDGNPHHPLYLKDDTKPFIWEGYKNV